MPAGKKVNIDREKLKEQMMRALEPPKPGQASRPYKFIMCFVWYVAVSKRKKNGPRTDLTRNVRNQLSHTGQVMDREQAEHFVQQSRKTIYEGTDDFLQRIERVLKDFKIAVHEEKKAQKPAFHAEELRHNIWALHELSKGEGCPYEALYRFVMVFEFMKSEGIDGKEKFETLRNEIVHAEDNSKNKSMSELLTEVKSWDWISEYLRFMPPSDENYESLFSTYGELEARVNKLSEAFPDQADIYNAVLKERLRPFDDLTAIEKMEVMEHPLRTQSKEKDYKGLLVELNAIFFKNAQKAFASQVLSEAEVKKWVDLDFKAIEGLKIRCLDKEDPAKIMVLQNAQTLFKVLGAGVLAESKVLHWICEELVSAEYSHINPETIKKLGKIFSKKKLKSSLNEWLAHSRINLSFTIDQFERDPVDGFLCNATGPYLLLAMTEGWNRAEKIRVIETMVNYADAMYSGEIDFYQLYDRVQQYVDFPRALFFERCFIAMIGSDLYKNHKRADLDLDLSFAKEFVDRYVNELTLMIIRPHRDVRGELKRNLGALTEMIESVYKNEYSEADQQYLLEIVMTILRREDNMGLRKLEPYEIAVNGSKKLEDGAVAVVPAHLHWARMIVDKEDPHDLFSLKFSAILHVHSINFFLRPEFIKDYMLFNIFPLTMEDLGQRLSQELSLEAKGIDVLPGIPDSQPLYALPMLLQQAVGTFNYIKNVIAEKGRRSMGMEPIDIREQDPLESIQREMGVEPFYQGICEDKSISWIPTLREYLSTIQLYLQHLLEIDRLVKSNIKRPGKLCTEMGLLVSIFALEWQRVLKGECVPWENTYNRYRCFIEQSISLHQPGKEKGSVIKIEHIDASKERLWQEAPKVFEGVETEGSLVQNARWKLLKRWKPNFLGNMWSVFLNISKKVKFDELSAPRALGSETLHFEKRLGVVNISENGVDLTYNKMSFNFIFSPED